MHDLVIAQRFDSSIRFFLFVLIFWIPYGTAVIEVCVTICMCLWFMKRCWLFGHYNVGKPFRKKLANFIQYFKPHSTCLNRSILFFILVCFLAILSCSFLEQSFKSFVTKTLEWFIIFFIVVEFLNQRKYIWLAVGVFLFSSFAVSLDAILQFYFLGRDIFFAYPLEEAKRATASFHYANSLAAFLLFVSVLSFSLIFHKQKQRLIFFIIFLTSMWSFGLSFSRAGWIAIVVSFLWALFYLKKKWIGYTLLALGIFVASFYLLASTGLEQEFRMDLENISKTWDWRVMLWKESWTMIADKPFFGHGLNMFMTIFQQYRSNHYLSPSYAHNCYLQMAAEIGIVGLITFLLLLMKFFKEMHSRIKRIYPGDKSLKFLLVGLISGVLGFLVHSLFDNDLYSLKLSAQFWITMGMAISVCQLIDKEHREMAGLEAE